MERGGRRARDVLVAVRLKVKGGGSPRLVPDVGVGAALQQRHRNGEPVPKPPCARRRVMQRRAPECVGGGHRPRLVRDSPLHHGAVSVPRGVIHLVAKRRRLQRRGERIKGRAEE